MKLNMNHYRFIINSFLFLLIGAFFFSCEDDGVEQRKGSVSFGFSISESSGRTNEDISLTHLIISAENDNGTVFENKEISLISFDDEYLTEPVSLNAGSYRLTKFLVAGDDGTVHYATPIEGSELAYLVSDPLPIHVVISKNEVIEVKPEVVSTSEGSVEDFGYGEFGFDIIETFDVLLGVFVFDNEMNDFSLTDAKITVYGDSDSLTSKSLFATTNKLTFPDRFEDFTFVIDKEGYNQFNYTFSSDSIKSFQGDNENGPLEIILEGYSLSDGLLAYYPFDGNANDETGNGFDGVVSGALLTTDRNGNANSAYSFDGVNDYIKLGDDFDESLLTVNIWFKLTDIDISDNTELLISSDHANKENGLWGMGLNDNTEAPHIRFNRNGTVNGFEITTDWQMATLVFDGLDYKNYLNGQLVNEGSTDEIISSKDGIAYAMVGCTRVFDRYYDGAMDDIRIYGRILGANEIDALYNEMQ